MPARTQLHEANLGYLFFPRADQSDIGHARLDVTLRPQPTEEHYDPEELRLRVATEDGGVEHLMVRHPWVGKTRYRATVGHILLRDRKRKTVAAFTYGGEFRVQSREASTESALSSSAPILRLDGTESVPELLAQETKVLLAEIASSSNRSRLELEQSLAQAEPSRLYGACLKALEAKLSGYEHKELIPVLDLLTFVSRESRELQWQLGVTRPVPDLQELITA